MRVLKSIVFVFIMLAVASYAMPNLFGGYLGFLAFKLPISIALLLTLVSLAFFQVISSTLKIFNPKILKKNRISKYNELRRTVKSGDVIAFGGNNTGAQIIRTFTNSRYSHVGLVLKVPMPQNKWRVFFIEADDKKGVVLVRLSTKLLYYNGKAALLKLKIKNVSQNPANPSIEEVMYEYSMNQLGRDYDFLAIKKITQKIIGVLSKVNQQDENSFICSELVGSVLQKAEFLKSDVDCSYLTPKDITKLDCFEEPIELIEKLRRPTFRE